MKKVVIYSKNPEVIKRIQKLSFDKHYTVIIEPEEQCELLCSSETIVGVIIDCTNCSYD